jgi:signal peptidase I
VPARRPPAAAPRPRARAVRALFGGMALVTCAFLLMGAAFVRLYRVAGESMEPGFSDGELVVAFHGVQAPGRVAHGDVVILRLDARGPGRIKRVIGLPGDTLVMRGGRLYRNGRHADDAYETIAPGTRRGESAAPGPWHYAFVTGARTALAYRPTGADWGPISVPAGRFFVLGDNRAHSGDSRRFGFVRQAEIEARVIAAF